MIFIELPEETYKVQTKIIVVDFTKGKEIFKKIEEEIKGLEIGILVNNVGKAYWGAQYFHLMHNSEQLFDDMIHCNVTSVVQMTRIALPQMIERQKGLIINISSLSSLVPAPLMGVYAATKAFINKFGEDLRLENKQHGITIQTVIAKFTLNFN
jgi:17beta-estradiol 17-dehydrogenase / very-long-chain 3-oxoacyl-CoA reductase